METYIQPAIKEAKVDAEEIMDDGFVHQSEGSHNQLANDVLFDEEDEEVDELLLKRNNKIWE